MIHIIRKGQKQGPFSLEDIQRMLSAGALAPDDLAWQEGSTDWQPLSEIIPPPVRSSFEPPPPPKSARSNVGSTMQIITIKPLVERFRAGTFKDEEVGPYFFAYAILEAVTWMFAYREATPWHVAGKVTSIIITIFGILHLKRQNRGSFGNGFLNRYFALGWVIMIRTLLISILLGVVLGASVAIIGDRAVLAPIDLITTVAVQVLFYWWLGVAIAESQQPDSEQS